MILWLSFKGRKVYVIFWNVIENFYQDTWYSISISVLCGEIVDAAYKYIDALTKARDSLDIDA